MQAHYKKLFAIHKQLLKREIPEDVIPLFFEFLGDLNETPSDLDNKHCFYEVTYEKPYYLTDGKTVFTTIEYELGYYCNVCNKILLVKTEKQLKLHCRSNVHCRNLRTYSGKPPQMHRVQEQFQLKNFNWNRYSPRTKKEIAKSVKIKKITLHNITQ